LDFLKQFWCRDSLSSPALKLSRALAMFLTRAMPRKEPFRLYVTHFDRHVITGNSTATICRDIMR